jgi:broad specificity phosphatase PhoE
MSNLGKSGILEYEYTKKFLRKNNQENSNITPLNDPVLTNIGVEASIYNGCIINKIFKSISNSDIMLDTFNIVGCSPLIRCMETSYYMTRKWKNPPNKIYVFPLLREIDESSVDKYSQRSKEIIRITPSYSIKTIKEQKEYLKSLGILDSFDFSFVEAFPIERIEPGDIQEFMYWFAKYFVKLLTNKNKNKNLNVFITTHAGVLRDFSKEGFYNNSGFVINTKLQNTGYKLNRYISLNKYIEKYNFFKDYNNPKYNKTSYYCPSNRCGQLCNVASGITSNHVKKIGLECNIDNV